MTTSPNSNAVGFAVVGEVEVMADHCGVRRQKVELACVKKGSQISTPESEPWLRARRPRLQVQWTGGLELETQRRNTVRSKQNCSLVSPTLWCTVITGSSRSGWRVGKVHMDQSKLLQFSLSSTLFHYVDAEKTHHHEPAQHRKSGPRATFLACTAILND